MRAASRSSANCASTERLRAASTMSDLFSLSVSPLELMLRGTVIFWFLFLVMRFILRRDIGSVGVSDFLFVVLLGDAAQNAMIGDAHSISDGLVLLATLVGWNFLLDLVSYRVQFVRKLTSPPGLCLVRDGKVQRRALRREFITTEELVAKAREQGIDDLSKVHRMFLEADGEISVITDGKGR
jgi:uncharacterized membrane protein YcaP (DUF421 family)